MKNNNKKILFSLVLALLMIVTSLTTAKEKPDPRTGRIPPPVVSLAAVNNVFMQANNINTVFRTDGYFNYDKITFTSAVAGMVWPVSAPQRQTCDFSTGLWIAGLVNGQLRTAVSLYNSVYTPGGIPIPGSVPPSSVCTDPKWKAYHVQLTDPNLINGGSKVVNAGGRDFTINFDAWSAWPVDMGAPYVEVNGIPGYQPGPDADRPGVGNSDARPDDIIFFTFMDYTNCTNAIHQSELSLPGGTLPLGVEVQQLAFAFNSPGLTNMYFTKFKIINKSSNVWDSTYVSVVNDVDDGDAADDAAGCDSTKSLGFIYNADNFDVTYGSAPPAVGSKYLQSPIIYTGNPQDSVKLPYITLYGYKALGMTGFNVFTNLNDPCSGDPDNAAAGYNFMKGFDGCGNPTINWQATPPHPSKYKYNGSYCGGLTGWYDSTSSDRRFIQGSGPFVMNPNDTQTVTIGLFVERGSDNIGSVCKLIVNSARVQRIYDNNFRSIPLPPAPQVTAVADGDGKVTLYWGSISESYHAYDVIDTTGFWDFEGYEVYQIKPGTGGEADNERSLLAVYDVVNDIDANGGADHIMDSVEVIQPNGLSQVEWVPVTRGTNIGVSRIITLTQNKFPSGVNNYFINGQTYKFAVLSYGVNKRAVSGAKVLKNQIGAQVFSVTPNFPIMGTVFSMKNLDTLTTNRIDRSFLPVVVDPKRVVSARYQMVWNSDTSWNIVRIMNAQIDTVAKNSYNISKIDNRAYVIDGIIFKADTIAKAIYGVIKDPGAGAQTSGKGWDYTGSNTNFAGVDTSVFVNFVSGNFKPMQSMSMGLSWPSGNTYKSGFTSKIDTAVFLKQSSLKRVKFNFGQTQKAYRYSGAVNNSPYKDYVDVPFTVTLDDPLDTNGAPRQLNCAFYDYDSSGTWNPKATLDGGLEMVFVFYSSYSATPLTFYTTKNIQFLTQFKQMDIEYVWWPRVVDGSRPAYVSGDVLTVLPYTRLQHFQSPGMPTVTEVSTTAPTIGSNEVATQRGEMEDIRVVPNPYYGGHANESSPFDRFVKFTRMPKSCNIFIYSLSGNLVRKIVKNDNNTTINWDLLNTDLLPVASGIYIAYIDAPGIGTKIVKLAIFTPEERIDRF